MSGVRYDFASIRRLVEIAKLVKGKRVLDIGCRDAVLKKFLPLDVEYWGLEISDIKLCTDKCRVVTADICAPERSLIQIFDRVRFDTIVLGETLEHLRDPLQALHNIRELLLQHGQLVGSVPNALSWRSFFLAEFLERPPKEIVRNGSQHLFSFTKSTLRNLLSCADFKVQMVKEWGNWIPHTGIFLPFNTRGGHLIFVARK